MHNVKRLQTGPHTPWPNRAEMGERLLKNFLSALEDTASGNLDQTTLPPITPVDAQRSDGEKHRSLSVKTPMELAVGRRPRDLMDLSFHESRTDDIYTNQTGPTQ